MSALETASHAKVLKGGKSPAARFKQKMADVEAKVAQARAKLDARNARIMELKSRATGVKKQLEQSALWGRVAEPKYLLLYDEADMLKQRLATGVYCNGEIEQRLIDARKKLLGYMDALFSMAVKSQDAPGIQLW